MKHKALKSIICSLLVVVLLSAPMSALAASKVAYLLKVSVSSAPGTYVRSGNKNIIGSLRNGTRVLYWGNKRGQMLKVMAPDGTKGYVYQGHLKTYGAMGSKQVYLTKGSTGVYKRSGGSMKKTGSVRKNVPVIVYSKAGSYSLVKSMSGKTGYIKTSKLKKAFS